MKKEQNRIKEMRRKAQEASRILLSEGGKFNQTVGLPVCRFVDPGKKLMIMAESAPVTVYTYDFDMMVRRPAAECGNRCLIEYGETVTFIALSEVPGLPGRFEWEVKGGTLFFKSDEKP